MKLRIDNVIKAEDQKAVVDGLIEYNMSRIENMDIKDLGIYHENENGEINAGLIASTHGNWLLIKYLWVYEDLRGTGVGSELLSQAEITAKERGCKYAFLDTFDFQAPKFYERKGYKAVFVLKEYPVSGNRSYYVKTL